MGEYISRLLELGKVLSPFWFKPGGLSRGREIFRSLTKRIRADHGGVGFLGGAVHKLQRKSSKGGWLKCSRGCEERESLNQRWW